MIHSEKQWTFQWWSAIVMTCVLYACFAPWSQYITHQRLSSDETYQFQQLIDHPETLVSALKRKIQKHPDDETAWRLLAGCYHQLNQHQDALYAAQKSLEIAREKSRA